MNRTERFYLIHQMLRDRHTVSIDVFLKELGVSRATFKRDIEYLRDRLHAPIIWDRDARGYRFDDANQLGPAYALPGLWFSSGELYALLVGIPKLVEDALVEMEPRGEAIPTLSSDQERHVGSTQGNRSLPH